jgi:hypothetical protein
MTLQGLREMKMVSPLSEGRPFYVDDPMLAIADKSTYHLFKGLLADGWSWKALPKNRQTRECLADYPVAGELPNGSDAPKVFYTGTEVVRLYLECIAGLDMLAFLGVDSVPHGRPSTVYEKMLKGEAAPALLKRGGPMP